jgi:hypothetical protein
MSGILKAVEELISKAQGYTTKHTGSGGVAEAVNHELATAPKEDEAEKETNAANSGTHPKSGGKAGSSDRAEGGSDFEDGGGEQDEIQTPKGSGGRAPVARPATIKHEGGGIGPNHPGTATSTQSQQKSENSPDLTKGENPFEKKDDDDDDKGERSEKKDDDDDDDAKKSEDPGEVYLDIDEFTTEIVAKAVAQLDEKYSQFVEQSIQKSNESEYVEAGLAKSLAVTLDRVEQLESHNQELEKAIVNIANAMNIRKSLLKSADNIKGIENPSLSKTTLSKGEISSRLLDMQMQGNQGVDTNMVLRFDAVGDTSLIPENVRTKLGIE